MISFTKTNGRFYENFKDFLKNPTSFLKSFGQKSFKIYKF